MKRHLATFALAAPLLVALAAEPASAQKHGGILRIYHWDSPASMSIHEEATYSTVVPMMGVFNNLVMYKQDEPKNSLQSIVPDLATRWSWSEDGIHLTFTLREGVKWHDAGSLGSRGRRRWSAASSTAGAWKMFGSTNSRLRFTLNPAAGQS